ncbi:hypothetical protein [Flavobacterium sp. T12S277]|uniref:hypothetical protein n=1 Tax=Flavobacterium sp. T12S277 TaxID=3402752 RepID=UPI003ADF3C97
MKNIKLIFTSMLFLLIAFSCDDDGGTSKIGAVEGATPNINKIATADQGINILALQGAGDLNLGLTLGVSTGEVSSMDVVGYFTKSGVVSKATLQANVTTFPATLKYTKADLIKAFPTFASFGLLDKLVITADLKLKDGSVLKMFTDNGQPAYGADVANSTLWKVQQTYTALCPLNDASQFNGNYKVTADTWQDYGIGDIVPVVYNAANGKYVFRILNTANPYLINGSTSYIIGTINPATNAVTVTSNEQWNYGPGQVYTVTGTGNVSSCTGDINLKISFSGSSDYTFNLVKAP